MKKLQRKKRSRQKPEDMIETNPKNRWEEAENHLKEKQKTVENSQLKRSIYGYCKRDKELLDMQFVVELMCPCLESQSQIQSLKGQIWI